VDHDIAERLKKVDEIEAAQPRSGARAKLRTGEKLP
jgi:hypothetical protein